MGGSYDDVDDACRCEGCVVETLEYVGLWTSWVDGVDVLRAMKIDGY
jgi:hypothetical protein